MNYQQRSVLLAIVVALCMLTVLNAKDIDRTKQKGKVTVQHTNPFKTNDLQKNTVSKVDFYTTNYGIFGLNVAGNVGGGRWPRGSTNQYIFGGGVWFGAIKNRWVHDSTKNTDSLYSRPMSVISYDPNSGSSEMAPGRIEDGDQVMETDEGRLKYRTYLSTDFSRSTGVPLLSADGPNWCLWDDRSILDTISVDRAEKGVTRYFGDYVYDVNKRSVDSMPVWDDGKHKGPVIISGEDIFSVYKDTDLRNYPDGADVVSKLGYPLRLQYEQTIYSWGFGDYANFIFIAYNVINKSQDTLRKCWMAPAYDFDIGPLGGATIAGNDRVNYYHWDTTLNLAFQWSEAGNNAPEKGKGLGYIGMDFLESPAVDSVTRNVRHDKSYYQSEEQIGLQTFQNWVIANDPTNDIARYNFMSAGTRGGDVAAGDKRFLMATGPFNMLPGDTARVVIGMIFALPGLGGEATGDSADLSELVRRDKFAQKVYDDAFATPKPPDPGPISWKPLNNAVIVTWDETAENSVDKQEKGFDFLGYRLYRARVNNLDTFSLDQVTVGGVNGQTSGPFGWKQIAQWEIPNPYTNSVVRADSTTQLSPYFPNVVMIPKTSWSAYSNLYRNFYPSSVLNDTSSYLVRRIPSLVAPWAEFWNKIIPRGTQTKQALYDSLTLGIMKVAPTGVLLKNASPSPTDTAAFFYRQVVQSKATIRWMIDNIEDSTLFRNIGKAYIDSVTNHRQFIDYGDDNGDGVISTDADLTKTEKLINNVDYYYRLLAYDQGDYLQATPQKMNSGIDKVNQTQVFPLGAPAMHDTKQISVEYDSSDLGGLYNFHIIPGDQQRLNELFANHKIQLQFFTANFPTSIYSVVDTVYDPTHINPLEGIYSNIMRVTDLTTNTVLADYSILYETVDCNFSNPFSECSVVEMGADQRKLTIDGVAADTGSFVNPFNKSVITRYGSFSTDRSCNAPYRFVNGALGIGFDFALQQFGGYLRPLSIAKEAGTNADVQLEYQGFNMTPNDLLQRLRLNGTKLRYETYNNGPGKFEIEFLPGGTDVISSQRLRRDETTSVVDTQAVSFTEVSYLNLRVRNIYSFKRYDATLQDSVVVQRTTELNNFIETLPDSIPPSTVNGSATPTIYPSPLMVPIGSYNISANGWYNGRYTAADMADKESGKITKATGRRYQALNLNTGAPIAQGRYYLSKEQAGNTLDFTHFFLVNGAQYLIDFAAKGGRNGQVVGNSGRLYDRLRINGDSLNPYIPQTDFKAGDKIVITDFGGAFGLPKDSAKVVLTLSSSDLAVDGSGNQEVTNDDLSKVVIVPNPYVITHSGQKSSYDAKIYFMHLPKVCTIKIYTINGDLVNTINHVDESTTSKQGMDYWNLLSSNRQRSASQGLFAVIETPSGAKIIKKFAIVVGGARLIGN